MFGLFKPKPPFEPLDPARRRYFGRNILWLEQEFPEPLLKKRKIFRPVAEDFPMEWSPTEACAHEAMTIVAAHMQIQVEEVALHFYESRPRTLQAGRTTLFMTGKQDAAGLFYRQKNERDQYQILLDSANLRQPDSLIAVLAHELSHLKLLGHKGLEKNDEHLTDLATVFFGFGIFNAGVGFQFYKNNEQWGHASIGYLKQQEWAYALALLAYLREEEAPDWAGYLGPTLRKDFTKCLQYITEKGSAVFE